MATVVLNVRELTFEELDWVCGADRGDAAFGGALGGAGLGAAGGAYVGGVIGAPFAGIGAVPGAAIGTVAGGFVGAVAGGIGGAFGGAAIYDWGVRGGGSTSRTKIKQV